METFIQRGHRVAPCDYMSLWHWSSCLICGIVSSLGHTIAREPLSHEETWNSPCGKGWMTHTYLLYDGENIKERTTVRPSITKQWDKTYSSQTMATWSQTHSVHSMLVVETNGLQSWTPRVNLDTNGLLFSNNGHNVDWSKKKGRFKHFKVYISTKHLWMSVRRELKAVLQTCCQYVELILETVEMIWEKWKR